MTIRFGFLDDESRERLIALARDGSTISRVTRRANAIVLLDAGWSVNDVAKAFLLDDDTIRGWRKLFEQRGVEGRDRKFNRMRPSIPPKSGLKIRADSQSPA